MEFIIGPYRVIQRTEFSKMHLLDRYTKEDITNGNESILDAIVDAHKKQSLNPYKYFTIIGGTIVDVSDEIHNTNYLFIPDGTETIDRHIFHNFPNLCEVYIPESLRVIDVGAFSSCGALRGIQTTNLMFIANKAFYNCSSLENVVLNDSIDKIDDSAFANCKKLRHITLPKNLTILCESSFWGCSNLECVIFPDTLKMIKSKCFAECISLKEVILPDNLSSIDYNAFMNCTQLESVKLPDNIKILRAELFSGCENLKNIFLPNSIVSLGDNIFSGTKVLESINVPKNLEDINGAPFANSRIKSLIFNYNLESLNKHTDGLICDTNINKLIINDTVKKITPYVLGSAGHQIKEIEYLGTEKEFRKFKRNNKKLFEKLTNIEKINFSEQSIKMEHVDDLMR